ncbi:MAG TPA: hypothetical protein VLK25_12430 [Allosphingosinicella sp.]|nr:hypothetical protein [Allosphingosinicella sp.]
MAAWHKFLIGLALALGAGWLSHGPLGRGEAFVGGLEARAKGMVDVAAVPGISVHFSRSPLSRVAVIADRASRARTETDKRILREGMGDLEGMDGRMMLIPGVSGVQWEESE